MNEEVVQVLKDGGIAVIPTDTLYGIVGSALLPDVVARIYKLKGRDEHKPFIVLIDSIERLADFGVELSADEAAKLSDLWPGPVTVILLIGDDYQADLKYLHRGTNTLAFRFPNNLELLELLKTTGPLVAPSANPQGGVPAQTVAEAEVYFGERIDMYVDGGEKVSEPSTMVKFEEGEVIVLRQGSRTI